MSFLSKLFGKLVYEPEPLEPATEEEIEARILEVKYYLNSIDPKYPSLSFYDELKKELLHDIIEQNKKSSVSSKHLNLLLTDATISAIIHDYILKYLTDLEVLAPDALIPDGPGDWTTLTTMYSSEIYAVIKSYIWNKLDLISVDILNDKYSPVEPA